MRSDDLAILDRGVNPWNEWRAHNPSLEPDLSGADLSGRRLRKADLSRTNLSNTDLRDANLRRADLTDAKLNGATIYRTFFSGTTLDRTSFRGAILYEAVFANVDLSTASDLDTCRHKGPSVIDHRTLARSKNLSRDFLRGCGLPDAAIQSAPPRYWSCFISYASDDEEFAKRLYANLQSHGVRCWFAPEDMRTGGKIREEIADAIRGHQKVLLVLSERSTRSEWVEDEMALAVEEEKRRNTTVLVPIAIDAKLSSEWARMIGRKRHIGDFSRWREPDAYPKAFARLLRDLEINTQSASAAP